MGIYNKISKTIFYCKKNGFKATYHKVREKIFGKNYFYHDINKADRQRQRDYVFTYSPLVSIVVPVFNPKGEFLCAMLDSVTQQTYANWELCVANAGDDVKTIKILKKYEGKDQRIKVKYLSHNGGISQNSNEALSFAAGDYIAFLDHDDLLTCDALFEMVKAINENNRPDLIYSDEDKTDANGKIFFEPHFKSDFAPDMLSSYNYICHFTVISKRILQETGYFRREYDGSQDYDLFLRISEKTKKIIHVPRVLYHWRVHNNSTANSSSAKPYTHIAGQKALKDHLYRLKIKGDVMEAVHDLYNNMYRIKYELVNRTLVTVIIPNYNHKKDLEKCLNAIFAKTTYENFEIIIVENNSTEQNIFEYYEELAKNPKIRIIYWGESFNYSAINNWAVTFAKGDYLVFMNNDIEITTEDWIEEMLMFAQRKDVGVVGAKLYYPDETIQHAGVIVGLGGVAAHSHKHFPKNSMGYFGRHRIIQNFSAVTAALMMVPKEKFIEVKQFNEKFEVAFNDVDFCLKIREKDYLIVFNPYVEAYHYESKSRGLEDTAEKIKRFNSEISLFKQIWGSSYADPYYNINLSLDSEDFSLK